MHRSDLWEGPSRYLGIGFCCLLFLAGCSRSDKGSSSKLTGEDASQLRALAAETEPAPPVAMGPAALQPSTPLQQNENGYWIVLDPAALPPLLPPQANALQSNATDIQRANDYAATRDAAKLKRSTPFFDETALAAAKTAIAQSATSLGSGAALGWNLSDGLTPLAITPIARPLDDDRSPLMLQVFRGWLESQYPSINALNKQWGTKFVHWHDIVPPTTDDVKIAHNPAYAALMKEMLAPPPPPPPPAAPAAVVPAPGTPAATGVAPAPAAPVAATNPLPTPVLPKDVRIDDPPKHPERVWDVREGVKGFTLLPNELPPVGHENYSAWSDWRAFNDFVYNRLLREYSATARASGIQTPIGLSHSLPPLAYNNTDMAQLGRSIQWIEPGEGSVLRDVLRDLAPQVKRLTRLDGGAHSLFRLWDHWLRGDTGVIASPAVANEPTMNQELNFIARTLEPVRQRTTRAVDPIGIYYSPRSMQLHWMLDSAADGSWWLQRTPADEKRRNGGLLQFEAWRMLLDDLGYEPGYIQPEFVLNGGLRRSKLKVLILPKVLALSEHEAVELRAWVKLGGIVIADGACGMFDEHGKRRQAPNLNEWPMGILDSDFGLQRTGATLLERNGAYTGVEKDRVYLKDRVTGYAFGPSTNELRVLEPDVMQAGSYCHAVSTAGASALMSKAAGLGRMIYLNLAFQDYPELRKKPFCDDFDFEGISLNDYSKKFGQPPGGEALRLVVSDMLSEIVPENPIKLFNADGQPLRGVKRAHFDAGNGSRVVVLLPNGLLSLNDINRTDAATAEKFNAAHAKPAWITLAGDYHWYDVRTGVEVGHGDSAQITLLPDRATVLVALPYQTPKVRLVSRRTDPRGVYRVQANLVSADVPDSKHVFRADLVSPTGESEPVASLTDAERGGATWVIQLPADAPTGNHRLVIQDLLTGKRAETNLLKD